METQKAERLPLSGSQKALRFGIAVGVLLLIWVIWGLSRNPFMKPVRTYYKGLSHEDPAQMAEAFPSWLVDAPVSGNEMGIPDMCSASVTMAKLSYGTDFSVRAGQSERKEVAPEVLEQIASGIEARYHVKVNVAKGYWLTLNASYRLGTGDTVQAVEYVRVYKINGRWVMLDIPSETEE